ncbi:MAG: MCP four helix bundle domain-containing protein, partial [Bdellovibrio sp.]
MGRTWIKGIKGKLLIIALLPVVAFVVVFAVAQSGLRTLGHYVQEANTDIIPNIQAIGEMRQARNKFGYHIWAAIGISSPEKRQERLKLTREAVDDMDNAIKTYESTPFSPEMEKSYAPAKAIKDDYIKALRHAADLVEQGTPESIEQAKVEMEGPIWKMAQVIHKMNSEANAYYNDLAHTRSLSADNEISSANLTMLLVTLVSALLIFVLSMVLAFRLSNSINVIITKLSSSSENVSSSVEQLTEAGNSLSQSSTESAASLEETVASLEELTSMVKMNSDNAKQAAALS